MTRTQPAPDLEGLTLVCRIDAWACPLPLRAQPGQWRDNRKWPASDLPGAGSAQRDQRASLGGNERQVGGWCLKGHTPTGRISWGPGLTGGGALLGEVGSEIAPPDMLGLDS